MSHMKDKAIDRLNELNDEGKIISGGIVPSGSMKGWTIELTKNGYATLVPAIQEVILKPGEVWDNNKPVETETCIHEWHDILLFRFTVTECKKCGVIRED